LCSSKSRPSAAAKAQLFGSVRVGLAAEATPRRASPAGSRKSESENDASAVPLSTLSPQRASRSGGKGMLAQFRSAVL